MAIRIGHEPPSLHYPRQSPGVDTCLILEAQLVGARDIDHRTHCTDATRDLAAHRLQADSQSSAHRAKGYLPEEFPGPLRVVV